MLTAMGKPVLSAGGNPLLEDEQFGRNFLFYKETSAGSISRIQPHVTRFKKLEDCVPT